MRLLCVSDIHGNIDALATILATADKRNVHRLLVAGDIVFPGDKPLETWRRLNAAGALMVQGLTDKAISTLTPSSLSPKNEDEKERFLRMKSVQKELGELILSRLANLPLIERLSLENGMELALVHGSPSDPFEAMTFDMSDDELYALIGHGPAQIIVCGMSHVPFDRMIGDVRVINVGSVGDAPDGRETLSGRPLYAHATWIESSASEIRVEQICVPLEQT